MAPLWFLTAPTEAVRKQEVTRRGLTSAAWRGDPVITNTGTAGTWTFMYSEHSKHMVYMVDWSEGRNISRGLDTKIKWNKSHFWANSFSISNLLTVTALLNSNTKTRHRVNFYIIEPPCCTGSVSVSVSVWTTDGRQKIRLIQVVVPGSTAHEIHNEVAWLINSTPAFISFTLKQLRDPFVVLKKNLMSHLLCHYSSAKTMGNFIGGRRSIGEH